MTDAEILEMTYFDTCTIKRRVKQKNPKTGVTENVESVISENIKCALSKENTSKIIGEVGSIVSTHTLFTNPLLDIKAGDTVEVTNEILEKSIYLASKPFYYQSHKETQLTNNDRV